MLQTWKNMLEIQAQKATLFVLYRLSLCEDRFGLSYNRFLFVYTEILHASNMEEYEINTNQKETFFCLGLLIQWYLT